MTVRILADDLTGALDSAAQFAGSTAGIPVRWSAHSDPGPSESFALDTQSREQPAARAGEIAGTLVHLLAPADIAFKKIDSLLRGHVAEELAACIGRSGFGRCILAPAFPYQGRVTVGGRQRLLDPASGRPGAPVGPDLAGELARLGISVGLVARRAELDGRDERVLLCDAHDDEDLAAIAAAGRRCAKSILWCGTAGLAGALAPSAVPRPALEQGSVLAVVGSPHAVSRAQLARVAETRPEIVVRFADGSPSEIDALEQRLRTGERRAVLVPDARSARDPVRAARRIAAALARLVTTIDRPSRLLATGGATLSTICDAVGARSLEVGGQLAPGIPVSRARGGPWDGLQVVSKSGAFGPPPLLLQLLYDTL
ncbi:MAG: hypothetical protein JSW68_00800 [Burkholderiales bacterium]|nr:MAG: hypothetical protein JSW68_00800 [Burkholderiales bacterium]